MPRFQGKEPRIRGFNNNKIVFGPNEKAPKEISDEDLEWLREDPSFLECVRKGLILDVDGALGKANSPKIPEATGANDPGKDLTTILLQIAQLQTVEEIRTFAAKIPTTLSPDDRKSVEVGIAERIKLVTTPEHESKKKKGAASSAP